MAEQTTKPVEAKKPKGVTLYSADGREKTVTDPSVVVDLEFNGWSRNKSVFNKKKK